MKQMDTTKIGVREYLTRASEITNKAPHASESHKLAVVIFLLDAAEITNPDERKAVATQFMATPGWFGNNASAGRQAYEDATGKEKVLNEYAV